MSIRRCLPAYCQNPLYALDYRLGYAGTDAVSTATPLEFIGNGQKTVAAGAPDIEALFFGQIGEYGRSGKMGDPSRHAVSGVSPRDPDRKSAWRPSSVFF